ncbi:YqgE/AlgH family protein [Microvirga sp. W0021]|uniref:UPF0301 protein WJT86_04665 n=1 Tax=Hohaiivirga grylli TaxID=3133970 RepID=A0ABV0BHB7_9HYPH
MEIDFKKRDHEKPGFLEGHLLIAMPTMDDPRFERSVIYMCSHTDQGAMGIIINRPAEHIDFPELLVQLDIISEKDTFDLNSRLHNFELMMGGPVENTRGFVLHSPDYRTPDNTIDIDDGVCLTATVDILRAIARGAGPKEALLALGYAGWSPGQIESEVQANCWLTCPATADILFHEAVDLRYEMALHSIGVDLGFLSNVAGRA